MSVPSKTASRPISALVLAAVLAVTSLPGCCHLRPRPKVEHSLKFELMEKSPYQNPPDIKCEMGWKW